jgi:hypothetical protein
MEEETVVPVAEEVDTVTDASPVEEVAPVQPEETETV